MIMQETTTYIVEIRKKVDKLAYLGSVKFPLISANRTGYVYNTYEAIEFPTIKNAKQTIKDFKENNKGISRNLKFKIVKRISAYKDTNDNAKNLLKDEEKELIKNMINCFKDIHIEFISKILAYLGEEIIICFVANNETSLSLHLPKDSFKGLEFYVKYTLKELGIDTKEFMK